MLCLLKIFALFKIAKEFQIFCILLLLEISILFLRYFTIFTFNLNLTFPSHAILPKFFCYRIWSFTFSHRCFLLLEQVRNFLFQIGHAPKIVNIQRILDVFRVKIRRSINFNNYILCLFFLLLNHCSCIFLLNRKLLFLNLSFCCCLLNRLLSFCCSLLDGLLNYISRHKLLFINSWTVRVSPGFWNAPNFLFWIVLTYHFFLKSFVDADSHINYKTIKLHWLVDCALCI